MNGDWLTLGAIGALAVAGAARRGSADRAGELTVTREGWPWSQQTPLFHATTGLRAIVAQRFRVRDQGLQSALGGGTGAAVSFTLSRRVADAVLVGLMTLRRGARGEMSLVDLRKAFARECPKGAAAVLVNDIDYNLDYLQLLDRGLMTETGLGDPLPPGAIPLRWYDGKVLKIDEGWMGRDQRMYRGWWRLPVTAEERAAVQEHWDHTFYSLYNRLTMEGSQERECYYPSFWSTNMRALAKTKPADLGLIKATTSVPRICLRPFGARQLGYLTQEQAHSYGRFLHQIGGWCSGSVDGESARRRRGWALTEPTSFLDIWGAPLDHQIGPWTLVDAGRAIPETSLVYMNAMFEVRVYDPTQIEVLDAEPADTYLRWRHLEGRVTAPWTSDTHYPSGDEPPGQTILRTWAQ